MHIGTYKYIHIGWTGIFNFGKATDLGEEKSLNTKPEEYCARKSVACSCTIFLLSDYLGSVAGSAKNHSPL